MARTRWTLIEPRHMVRASSGCHICTGTTFARRYGRCGDAEKTQRTARTKMASLRVSLRAAARQWAAFACAPRSRVEAPVARGLHCGACLCLACAARIHTCTHQHARIRIRRAPCAAAPGKGAREHSSSSTPACRSAEGRRRTSSSFSSRSLRSAAWRACASSSAHFSTQAAFTDAVKVTAKNRR